MEIRAIQPEDEAEIGAVIRAVLTEFGLTTPDCAWGDPQLDYMFKAYDAPNSTYLVIEDEGRILGGGGFANLDGATNTCELQKLYILAETRGKGIGRQVTVQLLDKAKSLGYEQCYLETTTDQKPAIALYLDLGFRHLDAPLGSTGHTRCNVWMLKQL